MAKLYAYTFGRVPDDLLWDVHLSDRACRLYAVLTRYGDQWDQTLPDQEALAGVLGCSIASTKRAVAELKDHGALTVTQERDDHGQLVWAYRMPWEARSTVSPVILDRGDTVSPVTPDHSSPVTDGPTSGNTPSAQVAPQVTSDRWSPLIEERNTSPNGDGAKGAKRDHRSDTIVGQCIDALGYTPVERGAFAKIITDAWATASSPDIVLRGVREWGATGEPVSYLTGRIGQLDRAARTRTRKRTQAAEVRHDGAHDPACWCWQVPDDQRAKVKLGDLRAAAGLPVEDAP